MFMTELKLLCSELKINGLRSKYQTLVVLRGLTMSKTFFAFNFKLMHDASRVARYYNENEELIKETKKDGIL